MAARTTDAPPVAAATVSLGALSVFDNGAAPRSPGGGHLSPGGGAIPHLPLSSLYVQREEELSFEMRAALAAAMADRRGSRSRRRRDLQRDIDAAVDEDEDKPPERSVCASTQPTRARVRATYAARALHAPHRLRTAPV